MRLDDRRESETLGVCVVGRLHVRIVWALLELLEEEVLWCQYAHASVRDLLAKGGAGKWN